MCTLNFSTSSHTRLYLGKSIILRISDRDGARLIFRRSENKRDFRIECALYSNYIEKYIYIYRKNKWSIVYSSTLNLSLIKTDYKYTTRRGSIYSHGPRGEQ